jgi:hypothetical protein
VQKPPMARVVSMRATRYMACYWLERSVDTLCRREIV